MIEMVAMLFIANYSCPQQAGGSITQTSSYTKAGNAHVKATGTGIYSC
jgi:hypothetical protein